MPNFDELYLKLNDKQREAVDHIDGPMMVLAGAGTGKTQVLAMRIGKLLRETGVAPQNILCLTFTESGVSAMRKRLIEILGTTGYYVRVYTFHSFCNDVIADFPEKFAQTRELEALTDIEKVQSVQKIIDGLSVNNPLKVYSAPYLYLYDILKSVSNLKRENISVSEYARLVDNQRIFLATTRDLVKPIVEKRATELSEHDFDELILSIDSLGNLSQSVQLYMTTSALVREQLELARLMPVKGKVRLTDVKGVLKKYYESLEKALEKQDALIGIYEKYQKMLSEVGKYDFDDMILFVLRAFQKERDLLATYQEQFLYTLVDEYQDTNSAQNETVRLLGQGVDTPNIFVVGDDDQSIYRFQGASLENVMAFYQLYRDSVRIVCLTDNYRSRQFILDASGGVVSHNVYRVTTLLPEISKALVAHRSGGGLLREAVKSVSRGVSPVSDEVFFHSDNAFLDNSLEAVLDGNASGDDGRDVIAVRNGAASTSSLKRTPHLNGDTTISSAMGSGEMLPWEVEGDSLGMVHSSALPKSHGGQGLETDQDLERVFVAEFEAPSSELYWIVSDIKKKLERGVDAGEIAVLYRANRNADDLIDMMERLEIPFVLEAGQDILQDTLVKQLISLLRAVCDPFDDRALFTTLHHTFLGFSTLDLLKLARFVNTTRKASHKRYSYFEVLSDPDLLHKTEVSDTQSFSAFADNLLKWKELCGNEKLAQCVETIFRESGLFDYVLSKSENVVLLNRFYTFGELVKEENRRQKDLDYDGLLALIADYQVHDIPVVERELPSAKRAVHLMTAHKSKGLEFEYVYIMQVVDKVWGNTVGRDRIPLPSSLLTYDLAATRRDSNEDERRLFYVALTRAKDAVYITYSRKKADGREQFPSMFVGEIPDSLVTSVDTRKFEADSLSTLSVMFKDTRGVMDSDAIRDHLLTLLVDYDRNGFSVTHLNNYLKCPRLFYYQNFIKVPILKNKHLALGTAAHEAIEALYRSAVGDVEISWQDDAAGMSRLTSGKGKGVLSKNQFLKKFEKELSREILNDQDFADSLEQGKTFLGKYYDEYATRLPDSVLIEYDFRSHAVCLEDIPLTGKLDLVHVLDRIARTVEVVDFKTGNSENTGAMVKFGGDYHRQIVFYQLLCNLSKRFPYRMVRGVVDFVQCRKDGTFCREEIRVSEEDLARIAEEIRDVWGRIHALQFECLDPKGVCEYCERVLFESGE
jgi:superfamily I DNA/RNA helicase